MSVTKTTIYAIYASQDSDVLRRLLLRLHPLKEDSNLAIWSDDAINPGQRWKPKHESRLNDSDIYLLLLSNSFMYSDFIRQEEFKTIIDRYKSGTATILPVVVDNCPWDLEFSFRDYNFNFKELKVFPKNQKSLGDRNTEDVVFGEITNFLRALISPPDKSNALEENRSRSTAGQIAFDFFIEGRGHNESEKGKKNVQGVETKEKESADYRLQPLKEVEARETVIIEKKLRHRVQVLQRIEKEKSLHGNVNWPTGTKEEVEVDRRIKEENVEKQKEKVKNRDNARPILAQDRPSSVQDKGGEEVRIAHEKNIRKNRLARYNYQFKTAKPVKVQTARQKEYPDDEEARAPMAAKPKGKSGMQKSGKDSELEKRLGEEISVHEIVTRKRKLRGYNYQFRVTKSIDAKKVAVQEEIKITKDVSARALEGVNKKVELPKSENRVSLEKRFGEGLAKLKGTLKNDFDTAYDHTSTSVRSIVQRIKGVKPKVTKAEGGFFSVPVVKLKKLLGDVVATLKKGFSLTYNRSVETINTILQGSKEAKERLTKGGERRFFSAYVVKWKKTLVDSGETLNKRFALAQDRAAKSILNIRQATKGAKWKSALNRKGMYAGLAIVSLVVFGLLLYVFRSAEEQSPAVTEVETTDVILDSEPTVEDNSEDQPTATSNLGVGDDYMGGIVFTFDASTQTGKIAYSEDMGPMPWKDAIKIHEELGEGWRLPSLNELEIMYRAIGQGAANVGQFADELYWSATPFDKYQARLLRFSDGNTSYHYNNALERRKFLVRAIRDFER